MCDRAGAEKGAKCAEKLSNFIFPAFQLNNQSFYGCLTRARKGEKGDQKTASPV